MLDIRATAYISPVHEVVFASVPLTVRLQNFADETGLVRGKFRIYNNNTGSLIHTSEIAPVSLAAGMTVDVTALTDFDPPAPLDDTYFVVFDGNASNALVPDGIFVFLSALHFDVKPVGMGPAPAAHHATHESGGSDPINIAALVRANGTTSSATPTPNADTTDVYFLTALGVAATFGAPSGTPHNGQKLIIRILDDATPRALAWNAIYASRGATLPTTTVSSKTHYVGLIYNSNTSTWDCVAATVEA